MGVILDHQLRSVRVPIMRRGGTVSITELTGVQLGMAERQLVRLCRKPSEYKFRSQHYARLVLVRVLLELVPHTENAKVKHLPIDKLDQASAEARRRYEEADVNEAV